MVRAEEERALWWVHPEEPKLCWQTCVEPRYGSTAVWIEADPDHIEWDEAITRHPRFSRLAVVGHANFVKVGFRFSLNDVWYEVLRVVEDRHAREFSLFVPRVEQFVPEEFALVYVLWRRNPEAWRGRSRGFARVGLADSSLRERFLEADWHGLMQMGLRLLEAWSGSDGEGALPSE